MNLTISTADPTSPQAEYLIRLLSAELGARYGDDGSGAFSPADVAVPRAIGLSPDFMLWYVCWTVLERVFWKRVKPGL